MIAKVCISVIWGNTELDSEMNSSEDGVEKVLVIPLHAVDGRVDDFDAVAVLFSCTVADPLDSLLAGFGIANDAAFADVFAASFELWLDEDDCFSLPSFLRRAECGEDGGQDKSG